MKFHEFCENKDSEPLITELFENCQRLNIDPYEIINFIETHKDILDDEEKLNEAISPFFSGLGQGLGNVGKRISNWWQRGKFDKARQELRYIQDPNLRAQYQQAIDQKQQELNAERQANKGFTGGFSQGYAQQRSNVAQNRLNKVFGGLEPQQQQQQPQPQPQPQQQPQQPQPQQQSTPPGTQKGFPAPLQGSSPQPQQPQQQAPQQPQMDLRQFKKSLDGYLQNAGYKRYQINKLLNAINQWAATNAPVTP